jgi:hypothetical protein
MGKEGEKWTKKRKINHLRRKTRVEQMSGIKIGVGFQSSTQRKNNQQ